MGDVTVPEEKLDALLGKIEGLEKELQEQKLRTLKAADRKMTPADVRVPKAGKKAGVMRRFDPETQRVYDSSMKAWMWRRDNIDRCPCGEAMFAVTQEFVGQERIEQARSAVIDSETGDVFQEGWMFAHDLNPETGNYDGECLIPEELRRTEEKVKHMAECKARQEAMPFDTPEAGDKNAWREFLKERPSVA